MAISIGKKIVYALGQFGLVLCAYGAGKLFLSFYVPDGSPIFPVYVSQGYIAGLFTVAGLIVALMRLVDLAAGPFVGWLSDRRSRRDGRRTHFMSVAAIPLAIFSALIFFPPTRNALTLNAVAVAAVGMLFYASLSLYAVPYLALIPELGTRSRDRVMISATLASVTALASLLGNRIYTLMDFVVMRLGVGPLASFRLVVAAFAVVGGVAMLAPALVLDEREEGPEGADDAVREPFSASLAAVLSDRHFRPYLFSDAMFRVAAACVVTGFSWYVTVLLSLPRRSADVFLILVFFSNLALYFPVCVAARHLGKRKVLFIAFLLMIAALACTAFAGMYSVSATVQGMMLSFAVSVPYAVFSVLPIAVVSDLAVASERKTGKDRAGTYFGVHQFVMRSGELVAGMIVPVFLSMRSVSGHGAVPSSSSLRATIVVAAVFLAVGFLSLFGYREKEVTAVLDGES